MDYYTILTDAGRALEAAALAGKAQYTLTTCALGDGTAMPNPAAAGLQNEVWRGPISSLAQDDDNPTWLVIETNIPPADGGFTIREFGIYTDSGVLFAVGNYPETYKPAITEGTGVDLVIRPICQVSNATTVTLLTDTSVMMASKKYVDEQIRQVKGRNVGEVYYYQGRTAPFGALVADGTLVSRTLYPDLWAFAQAHDLVVSDTDWQKQATAQGGVGMYSSGDGTTTFRLPRLTDFIRGTGESKLVGTWQGDAVGPHQHDGAQRLINAVDGNLAMMRIFGGTGTVPVSNVIAPYGEGIGTENRPKTLFLLPCIHAYSAVIPRAQADMHDVLTVLADKEDRIKTLTEDTTIYVRKEGSDTNAGLTPADAVATVERAFKIIMLWRTLDYSVIVDIGPGTWPALVIPRGLHHVSNFFIQGAGSTLTVITSGTNYNNTGLYFPFRAPLTNISKLKITNTYYGIHVADGNFLYIRDDIDFGPCAGIHIVATSAATISLLSDWKISGGATAAISATGNSTISCSNCRILLTEAVNFSTGFAVASVGGFLSFTGCTYTGSATGRRYSVYLNGIAYTNGGGANYFPGNAAGVVATGGQYV